MKKTLSLLLTSIMAVSVFAGCQSKTTTAANTPQATKAADKADNGASTGKIVKMGLGQNGSVKKSKDFSADKGGVAQADVVVAAVGLDKDGKIASVTIDSAQTKVEYNVDGTIKTDVKTPAKSKKELGNEYGLKKGSKLGKEWFEQIEALEKWMTGKTIEQVVAIKTKPGADAAHPAVPTEADLTSSVSISVQDYIAAVEEAVKNAVEVKGGADKVGLGLYTSASSSKAKTADKGAQGAIDTYMEATALSGDKVAANLIDCMQAKVDFDATGKVTTNKDEMLKTKQELKDAYGMKKASSIKKEWYEQVNALSAWMVGKTADQVKGMKLADKDGKKLADEADLKTQITVDVTPELTAFDKTVKNAK